MTYGSGGSGPAGGAFTAAQRRALEQIVSGSGPLRCPACGGPLTKNDVPPAGRVSYVRRRVWLICADCRRSASVDIRVDR